MHIPQDSTLWCFNLSSSFHIDDTLIIIKWVTNNQAVVRSCKTVSEAVSSFATDHPTSELDVDDRTLVEVLGGEDDQEL